MTSAARRKLSARLVRGFRKNEADRANALIKGEPIIGPSARSAKARKHAGTRGRGSNTKRGTGTGAQRSCR